MKRLMLALLLFAAGSTVAFAGMVSIKINSRSVYQGQILKIQLLGKGCNSFRIEFQGREYKSFIFSGHSTALIGINYQMKPGQYILKGIFEVGPNFYVPVKYLIKVSERYPKLKYSPPKRDAKDQSQINEEAAKKNIIFSQPGWQKEKMDFFVRPVSPVHINCNFGVRRCRDKIGKKLYNCRYHLGIDYRAAFDEYHVRPEKIRAINYGRVILSADYLADGKIIVINHGNGIVSGYLHLSKSFVKTGDLVRRGQKIGVAGKTGAADAVHLHFFIKMDNGKTTVDPESFFKLVSR